MDISIKDLERVAADIEKIKMLEAEKQWLYYPISSPGGKEGGASGSPSAPTLSALAKIKKVSDQIILQQTMLAERVTKVNKWLDDLSDQELALIIRLHYINCLTWRETCKNVYGYSDRQVCRKRVMRYFGREK